MRAPRDAAMPPPGLCARLWPLLLAYFDEGDRADLDAALAMLAAHYGIAAPRIVWRRPQAIDRGRAWAQAFVRGDSERPRTTILAVHPRRWRTESEDPSAVHWVRVMLHELGHWADEADAEAFADRWAAWVEGHR